MVGKQKIKFWTVQSKDVPLMVQEEGIYLPDFKKSYYLELNSDLKPLYSFMLQSFNQNNQTDLSGLIFAFVKGGSVNDRYGIFSVKDFQEFYKLIQQKKDVITSLWKHLLKRDSVVMELEYPFQFNPLFLDINDFQILMPPISPIFDPLGIIAARRGNFYAGLSDVLHGIQKGVLPVSMFPSDLIQAHLPYIKRENLIATYPMFPLEGSV